MRIIIRKLLLLILTLIIITFSCTIILKLYKSANVVDKSNWTCYYDKEFNFKISHQKDYSIIKKTLSDNYIIKEFLIPINSPGIINNKNVNCYINVIKRNSFKNYLKNNRFIILEENRNCNGENYFYATSYFSYNSYFFKYNDYVFEIKEPPIGFSFEDSKIHEMTKNILIQSFIRNIY